MNATEALKLLGPPNYYYPSLVEPLGGVTAAVLFSKLFYWQDKAHSDLGVYKTRDELKAETGLSHDEQRTAIKKLKGIGVLIVTEKRLIHKTYYKIDNEKVNEIFGNFAKSEEQTPRTKDNKSPELDNAEVGASIKSISFIQELHTKNTNIKNNTPIAPKGAGVDCMENHVDIPDKNKHRQRQGKQAVRFNAAEYDIPEWLDRNLWIEWVDYRKDIGKPLKAASTVENQIKLLGEIRAGGIAPSMVINQSITNGWQGLFEPKTQRQTRVGGIPEPSKTDVFITDDF